MSQSLLHPGNGSQSGCGGMIQLSSVWLKAATMKPHTVLFCIQSCHGPATAARDHGCRRNSLSESVTPSPPCLGPATCNATGPDSEPNPEFQHWKLGYWLTCLSHQRPHCNLVQTCAGNTPHGQDLSGARHGRVQLLSYVSDSSYTSARLPPNRGAGISLTPLRRSFQA